MLKFFSNLALMRVLAVTHCFRHHDIGQLLIKKANIPALYLYQKMS